jgi:hypothetical protein
VSRVGETRYGQLKPLKKRDKTRLSSVGRVSEMEIVFRETRFTYMFFECEREAISIRDSSL